MSLTSYASVQSYLLLLVTEALLTGLQMETAVTQKNTRGQFLLRPTQFTMHFHTYNETL